jgi:hypothetical protein
MKHIKDTLSKDGPHDGMALTMEDLARIKANSIKVVTYHPVEYLDRTRSFLSI